MFTFSLRVVQKQMAFMLGRHGVFLELSEDVEEYEDLTEIMSNVQLNSNFLALAREVRFFPLFHQVFCLFVFCFVCLFFCLFAISLGRSCGIWRFPG